MTTLLIRLMAPLQSWGVQSPAVERDSGREPSKSGVVGLLAAALGRGRDEALDDLAALRMGVRVDQEGRFSTDYQTAGGSRASTKDRYGVFKANEEKPETVVTRRAYLADADFLVGMEGDGEVLRRIEPALRNPCWPIYLGRKAFVASVPVVLPPVPPWGPGLREESLEHALSTYPWRWDQARPDTLRPMQLRLVVEAPDGKSVRYDVPVSFRSNDRRYLARRVRTWWIDVGAVEIKE